MKSAGAKAHARENWDQEVGMEQLLAPRSIAVVGASSDPSKFSGRIIPFLSAKNYAGRIYPINGKRDEIAGIACHKTLLSVPGDIDCVVYSIGADEIIGIVEQCAQKAVKLLIVTTTGFAETGEREGIELQARLMDLCRRHGIRVLGPNCVGFINLVDNVTLAAAAVLDWNDMPRGDIGLVTQSGGIGIASVVFSALEQSASFSHIISTGNEADLDIVDFGNFLVDDENTQVIAMTIEGVRRGGAFKKFLLRAARARKPVVILKSGRSALGEAMAKSHTGALAGSVEVFDAVCRKYGATRVDDTHELSEVAQMFSKLRRSGKIFRKPSHEGLGVISVSGGHIGLFADLGSLAGLKLPPFAASTQDGLMRELNKQTPQINPIDLSGAMVADPSVYGRVLRVLLDDPEIEVAIPILTVARSYDVVSHDLIALGAQTDKVVMAIWVGGAFQGQGKALLRTSDIPVFDTQTMAVRALCALRDYRRAVALLDAEAEPAVLDPVKIDAIDAALALGREALSERESKEILAQIGFPVTRERLARSLDEAFRAAEDIGFPVALKGEHPDIAHKSDAGLVRLNIANGDELEAAFRDIMGKMKDAPGKEFGVLIQEMIPPGTELILGATIDANYGPLVMFGLGGIFVEVMKDVQLRVAPVSRKEAEEAIEGISGSKLLHGARGRHPVEIAKVADLLVALSQFVDRYSDRIAEIDINPLIAVNDKHGWLRVADALIALRSQSNVA